MQQMAGTELHEARSLPEFHHLHLLCGYFPSAAAGTQQCFNLRLKAIKLYTVRSF